MPERDGLLLIAIPVPDDEHIVHVRKTLARSGLRVAQMSHRHTVTEVDRERLVFYFGDDWPDLIGLGDLDLVRPAWAGRLGRWGRLKCKHVWAPHMHRDGAESPVDWDCLLCGAATESATRPRDRRSWLGRVIFGG